MDEKKKGDMFCVLRITKVKKKKKADQGEGITKTKESH